MKKIIPIIAALSAVSCMGGGNDEAVKRSITNINEELVVMQKSIADNKMSIEDLKAASSAAGADISANADAIAELRSEIAYLNNEIMVLKSKGPSVAAAPQHVPAPQASAEHATPAPESESASVDAAIVAEEEAIPADNQQIIIIEDSSAAKNSVYSYAIELNRQRKYTDARAKFQEFLEKYPKDALAGNAQYWIGETYYSLDEMPAALAAFQDVIKKYPKSNKVPDAMLKVAYVYDKQGDRQKAISHLKDLVARYPKTKPASLATQRLKSWGVN